MIDLSRDIPMFARTVNAFVKGRPDALLLVEFAETDQAENLRRLDQLEQMLGDLGQPNSLVRAEDLVFQKQIWEVRKQGLNIMMSMRGNSKPISIVEDCAVELKDLAEYTRRLTEVFEKHGTSGTWYAHASVGTLHVRPVLNLKQKLDVEALRAVAEEAFKLVREYKGSHSGEHGDGIARSEFHESMFGSDMVRLFEHVKQLVDPTGLFNPNKIVNPPKHDDRSLFRFAPEYENKISIHGSFETAFDWSEWGGLSGAVEMCNNNGACRNTDAGVMCPSYRVTKNEQDVVRGRANTLRLALSGQLGPNALTSKEMFETMKLCVGCKACQNECPTSVDLAKMKTEVLYLRSKLLGIGLRDKIIAYMPRYAGWISKAPWIANLRDQIPGMAWITEKTLGLAKDRKLPVWDIAYRAPLREPQSTRQVVVLFGDTFNRSFETKNLYAARQVLESMGFEVIEPKPDHRHICCGRTFLATGLVDQAKIEAARFIETVIPWIQQGVSIVGLEPSCLFTLRDEFQVLIPGPEAALLAKNSYLFEEFVEEQVISGKFNLSLEKAKCRKVLIHGHCHQKAAGAMGPLESLLKRIPELEVSVIRSSCCGMAGHFGYQKETIEASLAMGELDLLPAVRSADLSTRIVAGGTSCRHQIADNTSRQAEHVAIVLAEHLSKD
jgi:Fe-S oxidoreductase